MIKLIREKIKQIIEGFSGEKLSEKQLFEQANNIKPATDHNGFSCHGLNVREFTVHLIKYSDNKVSDFDDVELLLKHKGEILLNVENALANNDIWEAKLVSQEQARYNAQNFKMIFETLIEYIEKFDVRFFYLK